MSIRCGGVRCGSHPVWESSGMGVIRCRNYVYCFVRYGGLVCTRLPVWGDWLYIYDMGPKLTRKYLYLWWISTLCLGCRFFAENVPQIPENFNKVDLNLNLHLASEISPYMLNLVIFTLSLRLTERFWCTIPNRAKPFCLYAYFSINYTKHQVI
jgi:hypothetical protein